MSVKIEREILSHPILGMLDGYYVPGGKPYISTKELSLGAIPGRSVITIWTDPKKPVAATIEGAVRVASSDGSFRREVEERLFEDYNECTRSEYLELASHPGYGITAEMLPEIGSPTEIWHIYSVKDYGVSISEPDTARGDSIAEITLSFVAPFDHEHDFHVVFRNGKFYEITK